MHNYPTYYTAGPIASLAFATPTTRGRIMYFYWRVYRPKCMRNFCGNEFSIFLLYNSANYVSFHYSLLQFSRGRGKALPTRKSVNHHQGQITNGVQILFSIYFCYCCLLESAGLLLVRRRRKFPRHGFNRYTGAETLIHITWLLLWFEAS